MTAKIDRSRFFLNSFVPWEDFIQKNSFLLDSQKSSSSGSSNNNDDVGCLLKAFPTDFLGQCSEYIIGHILELFEDFPIKNLQKQRIEGSVYVGVNGIAVFLLRIVQIIDEQLMEIGKETEKNKESHDSTNTSEEKSNSSNTEKSSNVITDRFRTFIQQLGKKLNIDNVAQIRNFLLQHAYEYNKAALNDYESRSDQTYTLLIGICGAYAIRAVCYYYLGNRDKMEYYLKELKSLKKVVMEIRDCELLYGRMGYVSAFLFIQNHIGLPVMECEEVIEVSKSVIRKGEKYSKEIVSPFIWMWSWYNTLYYGGAHGVCGILYTMLNVPYIVKNYQKQLVTMIETCKKECQMQSGNYASSPPDPDTPKEDALVHWCHGAPGFVSLYCRALHTLTINDEQLFKKIRGYAQECNQVVWERGILRKGPGLCHGVGGNGYTFLTMYRSLNWDLKYLYQAFCFSSFLLDTKKLENFYATPDNPLSLFEGKIAGAMLVLDTIFSPRTSRFPCFE